MHPNTTSISAPRVCVWGGGGFSRLVIGPLHAGQTLDVTNSIAAVMFTGGRLVSLGLMSAPLLLSFVGFCFSLNFSMQGVNFTVTDFKRGQAALQRVYQVGTPRDISVCLP